MLIQRKQLYYKFSFQSCRFPAERKLAGLDSKSYFWTWFHFSTPLRVLSWPSSHSDLKIQICLGRLQKNRIFWLPPAVYFSSCYDFVEREIDALCSVPDFKNDRRVSVMVFSSLKPHNSSPMNENSPASSPPLNTFFSMTVSIYLSVCVSYQSFEYFLSIRKDKFRPELSKVVVW